MPITTDTSTDIGKIRLMIADTVDATAIYSDAEITAFFELGGSNHHRAAAVATRSIASDRSRLAKAIEREGYKTERQAVDAILKVADAFDKQATTSAGLVIGEFAITDEHWTSYRNEWHDPSDPDTMQ